MNNNKTSQNSVGFLGLLGILFIGLKLAGFIDWEWKLVFLPIYGPLVLGIIIILVGLLITIIGNNSKRKK